MAADPVLTVVSQPIIVFHHETGVGQRSLPFAALPALPVCSIVGVRVDVGKFTNVCCQGSLSKKDVFAEEEVFGEILWLFLC